MLVSSCVLRSKESNRIGLTPPPVAERVRKLEEAGVITGYRALVDYEALGFPIICIIRLGFRGGVSDSMGSSVLI